MESLEAIGAEIGEATQKNLVELLNHNRRNSDGLRLKTDIYITQVRELLLPHLSRFNDIIKSLANENSNNYALQFLRCVTNNQDSLTLGSGTLHLILESLDKLTSDELKDFLRALMKSVIEIKKNRRESEGSSKARRVEEPRKLSPPCTPEEKKLTMSERRARITFLCIDNVSASDPVYYSTRVTFLLKEIVECVNQQGELNNTPFKIKLLTSDAKTVIISWNKTTDLLFYRVIA